ncbi:MAG: SDR family NAD(P)-dependent oxidoreductase [Bacteroidetes bacterium]|nr:SDR family NAD(P)-dependent oxidoreductase [Bacteroidota bacterium]
MEYALVTGGSRGIGRAICISLAEMGFHILINYRSNKDEAGKTLETIKENGG